MSNIRIAARPSYPLDLAVVARRRPALFLCLGVVGAACLGQLAALDNIRAVLSTGAFFDTDDAMRAVQVRDLMAGQSWFDMTQTRLDPPGGVFMHWSRIVDVPLVLLIKAFDLITTPEMAERWARIAFPLLLTIVFFVLVVALCECLLGRKARWFALAAAFLYGPATGQFEPGRIDHHAPQIVLLAVVVWALAEAFVARRVGYAAIAGAAVALSMAISVENLPFIAAVIGALGIIWVLDGVSSAPILRAFAAGLAGASPLVFVATVAPSRWSIVADDALSLSQLTTLLSAGAALFLFAALRVRSRLLRAAGASLLAVAVGTTLVLVLPGLAERPFAHLDPVLRALWLDRVDEAQPLLRKWRDDPGFAIGIFMPALIGVAAAGWRVARDTDSARRRVWLIIFGAACTGLAASFVMVRTMAAVQALVLPASLALVFRIRSVLMQRHALWSGPAAATALILATSAMGWAAMSTRIVQATGDHAIASSSAISSRSTTISMCATPAAFAQLATLPKGLVLADPDLGGYILAHTHHAVMAGAYHRNERGMRAAIAAFTGDDTHADDAIRSTHAQYVVVCADAVDRAMTESAPDGLLAKLLRGQDPPTLRHLAAQHAPLAIYLVN